MPRDVHDDEVNRVKEEFQQKIQDLESSKRDMAFRNEKLSNRIDNLHFFPFVVVGT